MNLIELRKGQRVVVVDAPRDSLYARSFIGKVGIVEEVRPDKKLVLVDFGDHAYVFTPEEIEVVSRGGKENE